MGKVALAVQGFNKPDTLQTLLDSIRSCEGIGEVDLVIAVDSSKRHQYRSAEFAPMVEAVTALANAFLDRYSDLFRAARLVTNHSNLGTCKTCKLAIDTAFSDADYVIFTEDDTVFARDTIRWFQRAESQGLLADEACLAIAGDSIYFDARDQPVPPGLTSAATAFAEARHLGSAYLRLGFVPSTCFATTRAKWEIFREVRGAPLGDHYVNALCQNKTLNTVFPVVPRVRDDGMLHDFGHSVTVHGKDNVRERKHTYLLSDQLATLQPEATFWPLGEANAGPLFHASVRELAFEDASVRWPVG